MGGESIAGGIAGVAIAAVFIVVVFAIFTAIFRWLWNITMPDVFGVKTVTFWQALRILILASILFGGHKVIERTAPGHGNIVNAALVQS